MTSPYAGWQADAVTADRQHPSPAADSSPEPAPVLTDGVVTLRAHSLDDADAVVEQSTDPESLRWTTVPRPYSREHAVSFIEGNRRAWGTPDGTRSWAI